MNGWSLLVLQGLLAATGVVILVRRVYPALGAAPSGVAGFVADVWAPVAAVLPLLVVAARVGPSVAGVGWVPVGGPTCAGAVAVAAALWCRAGTGDVVFTGRARLSVAAVGTGLLLLLLSGAYDLTIWTGQCAFAMGALLLWINTPAGAGGAGGAGSAGGAGGAGGVGGAAWAGVAAVGAAPVGADAAPKARPGPWLALAVVCAAAQGAAALVAIDRMPATAATMLVVYAIAAAAGAVAGGSTWALRVGTWAAILGTLFGLGALSLVKLAPMSFAAIRGAGVTRDVMVAGGFGRYASEAILLMFLPAAAFLIPAEYRALRRPTAILLTAIAAALTTHRLLAM